MLAGQPRLVPKLQSQPYYRVVGVVVALSEHRRNRRGVNSSGHGYRNGVPLLHRPFFSVKLSSIPSPQSAAAAPNVSPAHPQFIQFEAYRFAN
jgi:hypothetical protein